MGNTTFSGAVRVGKKPYAAGTLVAELAVPSGTANQGTVVATLAPGSIVQAIMADNVGVEITFDNGTTQVDVGPTVTAGVPVNFSPFVSNEAVDISIKTGIDPSTTYVVYKPYDTTSGANA